MSPFCHYGRPTIKLFKINKDILNNKSTQQLHFASGTHNHFHLRVTIAIFRPIHAQVCLDSRIEVGCATTQNDFGKHLSKPRGIRSRSLRITFKNRKKIAISLITKKVPSAEFMLRWYLLCSKLSIC
jgi:hypothetical protein